MRRIAGRDLVLVLGVRAHGGDVLAGDDEAGLDQRLGRRRRGDDDVGADGCLRRDPLSARTVNAELLAQLAAVASALTASRAQMRASPIGRTRRQRFELQAAPARRRRRSRRSRSIGRDRCFAATAPAAAVRISVR